MNSFYSLAKAKREEFFISIRLQKNRETFSKNRKKLYKKEEKLEQRDKKLISHKLSYWSDELKYNIEIGAIARVTEIVTQIRRFINEMDTKGISCATAISHEKGLDKTLYMLLRTYNEESRLIEEITTITITFFSISNEVLMKNIANCGFIVVLTEYLVLRNPIVFDNVLFSLHNYLLENEDAFGLYRQFDIVKKAYLNFKMWDERECLNQEITKRFVNLVHYYLLEDDSFLYPKEHLEYLLYIVNLYISLNDNLSEDTENGILEYLDEIFFRSDEAIEKISVTAFWEPFLYKLVGNLTKSGNSLAKESLSILNNLTCTNDPDIYKYLLNKEFPISLQHIFKNNPEISKDIVLNLICNLICDDDFKSLFINQEELIDNILWNINNSYADMKMVRESVRLVKIFSDTPTHQCSNNFLMYRPDVILVLADLLTNDNYPELRVAIINTMHNLLELGEFLMNTKGGMCNPFIKPFEQYEQLYNKLQDFRDRSDGKVKTKLSDLLNRFFK